MFWRLTKKLNLTKFLFVYLSQIFKFFGIFSSEVAMIYMHFKRFCHCIFPYIVDDWLQNFSLDESATYLQIWIDDMIFSK